MSTEEQIDQVSRQLDELVERVRQEYDMNYATLIGILDLKRHDLLMEATEEIGGDDDAR